MWKRTLYILVFVQFVSAIGMSSIAPFLPLYVDELGSEAGLSVEALSGLVFSAQAFTMMLAAPVWGALADRRGRKLMVVRATLGTSVVVFLMGFARSGEELVLLRAGQGVISGIFAATTALVAATVPRERTGYGIGLLQVGLWSGVSIGPLVGGVVADVLGFQAAFFTTAALLLLGGGLAWWGVEEHFAPAGHDPRQTTSFVGAWQHALTQEGTRLTYLARFLSDLGRSMIMPFTALFVAELMRSGSSAATATGIVLGLSSVAGVFSAVSLGRLGDRIGHRHILTAMAAVAAVFYFPMALVGDMWQFAALMVLAGGATGGIFPTLSALLAGYTEPGEEGAVYGLESAIMSAARAISPMLGAGLVAGFGLRSLYLAAALTLLLMASITGRWLPDPRVAQAAPRPTSRVQSAPAKGR